MGFVAILQKLSGTEKLLWSVDTINSSIWGTFAYRNQGAAFLLLVLLITGVLYFFHEKRMFSKNQLGGPHYLLMFYIFLLMGSLWLSLSRGGIILGLLIFTAFVGLVFFRIRLKIFRDNFWKIFLLSVVVGFITSLYVINLSDWEEVEKRWTHLQGITQDLDKYDRVLSTKATWEMAQDRLTFGWGAGSFRYIFPIYQKEYNTLWYYSHHPVGGWYGRRIYNYAHNDWVQFLAEYGIIGSAIIFAIFISFVPGIFAMFLYSRSSGLLFSIGLLAIFIHNIIDFIFSCPAYWVAFLGTSFLLLKLFQLERLHLRNNL